MIEGRLAREHPELLARLLEGDLAEWEHSKLLTEFADDPESMAVLLDAEAALREVGGLAIVREASEGPSRAPLAAMAGLAVATAAALIVVGPFGGSSASATASSQASPFADVAAGSVSGVLPDDWHVADLPVQRGDLTASEEAAAIRLGALASTLNVAVSRSDGDAITETLRSVGHALEPLAGAGPARLLVAELQESAASSTVVPESIDPLMQALGARFAGEIFTAGQSAEYARLVALAGGTPVPPEWLVSGSRHQPVLRDLGALFGLDDAGVVGGAADFRDFLIRYATPSAWDR